MSLLSRIAAANGASGETPGGISGARTASQSAPARCQQSFHRTCTGVDLQMVRIVGDRDRRAYHLCAACRERFAAAHHFEFVPATTAEWALRAREQRLPGNDSTGRLVA